jgi:hypothetical protein
MKHASILLAIAASLLAGGANAAITLYSDRSLWAAAAGGSPDLFEDFNGLTSDVDLVGGSVDVAGGRLRIAGESFQVGALGIDAPPLGLTAIDVNGTALLAARLDYLYSTALTFTFAAPVISWGADINPDFNDRGQSVDFVLDGVIQGGYQLPVSDVTGFVGLISDTPFTTMRINKELGVAWHGIDDLAAHAAPVPATLALLATGLLGLRLRRCRDRDGLGH